MRLEVPISDRADAWLAEQSRATGREKAAIVAELVECAVGVGATVPQPELTDPEARVQRFLAWVATVPAQPGPPVNTHRSSIYE